MKKVKTLILLVALFTYLNPLSAQNYQTVSNENEPKKIQLIARAGINFSAVSTIINGKREREKSNTGYDLGLITDIRLSHVFYLQPGLELIAKGSKLRGMDIGIKDRVDLSMNAIYLQIPVLVTYKAHIPGWNNSFNFGMGPYFAYGVGGKISGPIASKVNSFGDGGILNRPDIGLKFELQFEMPKVIFNYGMEMGIAKMVKREALNQDVSINNWGLHFGMGYKF